MGDQWVHTSIPWLGLFDDSETYVNGVEFCFQSTAGARSKPIQIDVWATDANGTPSRIYTSPIGGSWPNNSLLCSHVNFSRTQLIRLGVSVLLHFANTTDRITLGNALAETPG